MSIRAAAQSGRNALSYCTRPPRTVSSGFAPLVVDLPATPPARTILSCVIDRSGLVRGLKLIETTNAQIARLIMDALPRWKFRPVLRRDTPIDVAAVLAFDVDVR